MLGSARSTVVGIALAMSLAVSVNAAELRIGARNELVMDPHFMWAGFNISYYVQIYGTLLDLDEVAQVKPALAVSWRFVDATTWEFKLRKGVTFHDGSPFTAADVVRRPLRPLCPESRRRLRLTTTRYGL
ncbi:MAG: hypothetical protein HY246_14220 [Proteobacteria bacterium]|nr:hypothetical protein [Pseudomonadota bacterium]